MHDAENVVEQPTPNATAPVEKMSAPQRFQFPYATIAMLALLALAFVAELFFPVSTSSEGFASPTPQTLVALGGLFPANVRDGEWYRLFTCAFLHGGPLHIILNGVALWMAGVVLESLVGSRWFLVLYFVGAVGGSLMSLATNDGHTVSVGASGAIMGLFSAAIILAQRTPEAGRKHLQGELLRVLVPSLLPFMQRGGGHIDFGAHLGGALAGAIAGGLLLWWMRSMDEAREQKFHRSPIALTFVLIGTLATLYGFFQASRSFAEAKADARGADLLPNEELPVGDNATAQWDQHLDEWLEQFPNDPRIHGQAAWHALRAHQDETAKSEWRRALQLAPNYRRFFPSERFEHEIRVDYASFLIERHLDAEAIAVVTPVCSTPQIQDVYARALGNGFCSGQTDPAYLRDLVPNDRLEALDAADRDELSVFLALYPEDFRVLMRAAQRAREANELYEAIAHMQNAVLQADRFRPFFTDDRERFRTRLALADLLSQHEENADVIASVIEPLCGRTDFPDLVALRIVRDFCPH